MKAKKYTKETILQIGVVDRGFPAFHVGDTIGVVLKIKEKSKEGGEKERLQVFQGDVIAMSHNGISSSFTIRKMGAGGVAVERVFPLYSPVIDSIKFVRKGRVRRAKLYYLRGREGRAARIAEHIVTREQREREALKESAR